MSFKSAVAASYAIFKGCFNGKFQTGKVSNFAYPAKTPLLCSWYSWLKHVASFPEPAPAAFTNINFFEVSM